MEDLPEMRKDSHIMVNVEPIVYEALGRLAEREAASKGSAESLSALVRGLIIKHLMEREVLTPEMFEA